MIIQFVVEGKRGKKITIPISVGETRSFSHALASLRTKLSLESTLHIDLRQSNGHPISPSQTPSQLGLVSKESRVFAFVDAEIASASQNNSQTSASDHPPPQTAEGETHTVLPEESQHGSAAPSSSVKPPKSSVTVLGGKKDKDIPSSQEEEEEEEEEDKIITANNGAAPFTSAAAKIAQQLLHTDRIPEGVNIYGAHFIMKNGKRWKGFARGKIPVGGVVEQEAGQLSVCYPTQLVELMRQLPVLAEKEFDCSSNAGPGFTEVPSTITGIDDSKFSRLLALGTAYGQLALTKDEYEKQMAFFPNIMSLPHSCFPTCIARFALKSPPFNGIVQVACPSGLGKGEEIDIPYPKCAVQWFFLLPTERRQAMIRSFYRYDCSCRRCSPEATTTSRDQQSAGAGVNLHAPFTTETAKCIEEEPSLTGAFPRNKNKKWSSSHREEIRRELVRDFNMLNIVLEERSGALKPTYQRSFPKEIAKFIKKYSLKHRGGENESKAETYLHKHHWRLSFARLAYLYHCKCSLCKGRQEKRDVPATAHDSKSENKKGDSDNDEEDSEEDKGEGRENNTALPSELCVGTVDKFAFDVVLDQLEAEEVFLPSFCPLRLPTYHKYRMMLSSVSDTLAAAIQRRSLQQKIDFSVLRDVDVIYRS